MRSSTGLIWTAVIIVVVLGAAWYFLTMNTAPNPDTTGLGTTATSTSTATSTDMSGANASTSAATSATVTLQKGAFSPSMVTIAYGGTVTFVDGGNEKMWVASDPHPVHSGYDGTSVSTHCAAGYTGAAPFDQCSAGTSYSFTFNKTGTWGFHNHQNPGETGTVVVQ